MEQAKNSKKVLSLITIVNYLNMIDRYILAALLLSVKTEMGLTDLQAGTLVTAFMIPHVLTTPFFGWLGDTRNRAKLIASGVAAWSVASMMTGRAPTYEFMLLARAILGIGESLFTVISVPFLTDHYPAEKQARAVSIWGTGLPAGAALGFILGGALGQAYGWRQAFYLVGIPGLIFAALIWFLPDPRREKASSNDFHWIQLKKGLFSNKAYMVGVAGYVFYMFAVAGAGYWSPAYIQRVFSVDLLKANSIFGGITVLSGLAGTLIGGFLGDRMNNKRPGGHMRISGYSMLIGFPLFGLSLLCSDLSTYSVLLFLAQFMFFISTSPAIVAVLGAVPPLMRTSAAGVVLFTSHILGDAISPPLIGAITDITGSPKMGMAVVAPAAFLCGILWWIMAKMTEAASAKPISN